ncbi:hypothetical protein ACTL6P_11595 [Endozoicomonas acroporae]|nr:hypothetical protein [Endozoicomonas acroporae]
MKAKKMKYQEGMQIIHEKPMENQCIAVVVRTKMRHADIQCIDLVM